MCKQGHEPLPRVWCVTRTEISAAVGSRGCFPGVDPHFQVLEIPLPVLCFSFTWVKSKANCQALSSPKSGWPPYLCCHYTFPVIGQVQKNLWIQLLCPLWYHCFTSGKDGIWGSEDCWWVLHFSGVAGVVTALELVLWGRRDPGTCMVSLTEVCSQTQTSLCSLTALSKLA